MANEPIIRTFTAADIEKYHRGQLSNREMHDLEKAALDDPFLADALEGYETAGVDVAADLAGLKKRLADSTENHKVIPMGAGRSSFPWLRAAALVVLVAGAGLLVYQFAFHKEKKSAENIALSQPKEKQEANATDSIPETTVPAKGNSAAITKKQSHDTISSRLDASFLAANQNSDGDGVLDSITVSSEPNATIVATVPSVKTSAEKGLKDKEIVLKKITDVKDYERSDDNAGFYKRKSDSAKQELAFGMTARSPRVGRSNNELNRVYNSNNQYNYQVNNQSYRTNLFRGRVTDSANNALPFANVTNTADNVGTYADAQGNFTLISPDSVLNVQVRSIGFENTNVQLKNFVANNQITLPEDKSLGEVVISNKRPNSDRSRATTLTLEEPEPVDGWVNYDTYLANNLVVPENFRSRQTGNGGEVRLSFEINKNGEPVNITVDQSLCESCDKEAIRLIKEGPKWKRKAKKRRTSVTISF